MKIITKFIVFNLLTLSVLTSSLISLPQSAFAVSSNSSSTMAAPSNSFNWSGYVATGGKFTGVSGTWIVPNPAQSGNSLTAHATWVGIGGVLGHDLIQAGTQAISAPSGQIQFEAWIEKLPGSTRTISMTVNAGDSITATITQQSDKQWNISLTNNTTGEKFQTTTTYNSSLSSAEWIQEMPSLGYAFVPIDSFGSVKFSSGWTIKDGVKLTVAQAQATEITMTNFSGQALATPSPLSSDGASFIVTRSDVATISPITSARGWHRVRVSPRGYGSSFRWQG